MLVENKKQKCKNKLIIIFSLILFVIFILNTYPEIFGLIVIFVFFSWIGWKISTKNISTNGILNCIQEVFVDKKRLIEIMEKRKRNLKIKKKKLNREESNKRLKDELSSSQFNQKENNYIKNIYYNKKDIEFFPSKITPKKEVKREPSLSEKHKSISSDFWKTKSIWDDYESVLDNFKK